jgi:hypothetical protein
MNMMIKLVSIFFMLLLGSPVFGEDSVLVEQIINKEGQFVFADGSSYYRFDKDGTFVSGPLGMSGRVISGTWKTSPGSSFFVINGKWSWLGGITESVDDRRRMTMIINSPGVGVDEATDFWAKRVKQPIKIYRPYFIIHELTFLKEPGK